MWQTVWFQAAPNFGINGTLHDKTQTLLDYCTVVRLVCFCITFAMFCWIWTKVTDYIMLCSLKTNTWIQCLTFAFCIFLSKRFFFISKQFRNVFTVPVIVLNCQRNSEETGEKMFYDKIYLKYLRLYRAVDNPITFLRCSEDREGTHRRLRLTSILRNHVPGISTLIIRYRKGEKHLLPVARGVVMSNIWTSLIGREPEEVCHLLDFK